MSGDDFVVSAHALLRFEERFPELYVDDNQAAHLIHAETEAAISQGRSGWVPPLELANYDLERWHPKGSGKVVWTHDKSRGYVIKEEAEGMVVTTVLKGKDESSARRMLYKNERPSRLKGESSETTS